MITHLHTRTSYSLLSSTLTIDKLIECTKKNSMTSIAICEENVLFSTVEFYDKCIANNIKPIIGIDKKIADNHFIFLAKNNAGYQELIKISSYDMTLENIDTTHLVTILYPKEDALKQAMMYGDTLKIEEILISYKNLNDFYVGIINTEHSIDIEYNNTLTTILKKHNIKPVALSYILYEKAEDVETLDLLTAIKHGYTVDDHRLPTYKGRYFRSINEMEQLYTSEQLKNTEVIAEMCNVNIDDIQKSSLPNYPVENSDNYLRKLAQKGLEKRCSNEISAIYQQRLEYELDIITRMNFSDYFLIVWDLILYATKHNILVGPGRGSAAGSLVSYCLGITKIDPIIYQLPFERFLNPERVTMPDIDIDFQDNRRDEMIQYVSEKYGEEHVSQIIVITTLKARAAIRDVGRVLGYQVYEVDAITKMIPNKEGITLMEAETTNNRLKDLLEKNKKYRNLYEIAKKIENFPRHISTHAAGIVLSKHKIVDTVPTIEVDGITLIQYTMNYLERFGLIKIDFLGLRNLTIIQNTIHLIEQKIQKKININQIPLNDLKTYELLSRGDTFGIFQLESTGIRELIKNLKPRNIEDISLVLALYRPGPMKNINMFLEKRAYPEKVVYPLPSLEPILKNTLGIMVYQEQIMQVAQKMANFSLGKADILRRAMSKKDNIYFEKIEKEFMQGCAANGYSFEDAQNVFQLMEEFANYGFNKAHSISYAMVAYQMAYLKTNSPLYFYTSLFNNVLGSSSKMFLYLQEAKKIGITVEKPNINFSEYQFVIKDDKLYFPLSAIKNLGVIAVNAILEERKKGNFKNFLDFLVRAEIIGINKKIIESLIYAGAFDCFNETRNTLLFNLERFMMYVERIMVFDKEGNRIPKFSLLSPPEVEKQMEDKYFNMRQEKEVLGFYFSNHPIIALRNQQKDAVSLSDMVETKRYKTFMLIEKIKYHKTKKGDDMCFITGSDESIRMDFVLMPKQFIKFQDELEIGACYFVVANKEKEKSAIIQIMQKQKN